MKRSTLAKIAALGIVVMPSMALAQSRIIEEERAPAPGAGFGTGAATGAIGGAIVGGPVGAAVGGAAGAVVGGIADSAQPRFRRYVEERHVPSYRYSSRVVVGTELPRDGIRTYRVPREYSTKPYHYTVVNHRTVVVDPSTRRVVQVISDPGVDYDE